MVATARVLLGPDLSNPHACGAKVCQDHRALKIKGFKPCAIWVGLHTDLHPYLPKTTEWGIYRSLKEEPPELFRVATREASPKRSSVGFTPRP